MVWTWDLAQMSEKTNRAERVIMKIRAMMVPRRCLGEKRVAVVLQTQAQCSQRWMRTRIIKAIER